MSEESTRCMRTKRMCQGSSSIQANLLNAPRIFQGNTVRETEHDLLGCEAFVPQALVH
jgi:hypothetical protein